MDTYYMDEDSTTEEEPTDDRDYESDSTSDEHHNMVLEGLRQARNPPPPENPPPVRPPDIIRITEGTSRSIEQHEMDRMLNTPLFRDHLPQDTPLPIYLACREPRCPSPPSKWDAPNRHRCCHHY